MIPLHFHFQKCEQKQLLAYNTILQRLSIPNAWINVTQIFSPPLSYMSYIKCLLGFCGEDSLGCRLKLNKGIAIGLKG